MEVTTRRASAADATLAREIHHAAYRNVVEKQFGVWDPIVQDHFFSGDWGNGTNFDVVCYQGVPCGYISVEDRGTSLHVQELVIAPESQGRGIGTHLLKDVMGQAAQRHIPVQLRTFRMNRALQLYTSLGFKETGRTETHILLEWTQKSR